MKSTPLPSVLLWFLPLSLCAGCEPTPDFKIEANNIPPQAVALMVGFKSDADQVAPISLLLPVAGLSDSQRARYSLNINLGSLDGSGTLSFGTVDRDGCLTSVLTAPRASKSSGMAVSNVQIDFAIDNPALDAFRLAKASKAPAPLPCWRIAGVPVPVPQQNSSIPTPRMLFSVKRSFTGELTQPTISEHLYGWGLERASIFSTYAEVDGMLPTCVKDLKDRGFISIMGPTRSPTAPDLILRSSTQIELDLQDDYSKLVNNTGDKYIAYQIVSCLASSPLTWNITYADGESLTFREPAR